MKGRLARLICSKIQSTIPKSPASFVSMNGCNFPYFKADGSKTYVYTNNIQYCTILLTKPKVISADSSFLFGHYEAFSFNGYKNDISNLVAQLCELNKCSVSDLRSDVFSCYFASSDVNPSFSRLRQRSYENKDRLISHLSDCGFHCDDIDEKYVYSSSVITDGVDVKSLSPLASVENYIVKKLRNICELDKSESFDKGR